MTDQRPCITGTAAAIDALLNVPCHEGADAPLAGVLAQTKARFGGALCDRVFYYNPDAVADWVYRRHRALFGPLEAQCTFSLPLRSVVPPVTPVCFASMYSGLQPAQHGIQKYEKPVLRVPTVFDDLPAAGKRAAIVSTLGDSISKIFLERNIDYFLYKTKEECNAKAAELIETDGYDLIVLYNGDYDHWMHRFGPEGRKPLQALGENTGTYCCICNLIRQHWGARHRTLAAFAPDHGCHRKFGIFGTHGDDEPQDMEITHFYTLI